MSDQPTAPWWRPYVIGAVFGLMLGWAMWSGGGSPAPIVETAKPAKVQADGSQLLERQPASNPGKPPHQIPKGGKERRRVEVTLQPETPDCPPVTLDLSIVEFGDGSKRVVASSEDGRVTGGLDIPFREPRRLSVKQHKWAAGISRSELSKSYGVFVHRDVWRFRIGLEVNADGEGAAAARALVGWTW